MGSKKVLEKGLHLDILFKVKSDPFATPNLDIA
jgi:hypothetical protein